GEINGVEEGIEYILRERFHGKFERRLQINVPVNVSAAEATYENGVLRLVLPKAEEAKPRRIMVNVAQQNDRWYGIATGGCAVACCCFQQPRKPGRRRSTPPSRDDEIAGTLGTTKAAIPDRCGLAAVSNAERRAELPPAKCSTNLPE